MEEKKQPLSPHLQIYKWQISSLLSITHRIVGVFNIFAITLICIWAMLLPMGESNYEILQLFLKSFIGKFFIISLCWSFSFFILNEIRHFVWDLGFGFDLNIARISGILVFFGSFALAILFYIVGRNFI